MFCWNELLQRSTFFFHDNLGFLHWPKVCRSRLNNKKCDKLQKNMSASHVNNQKKMKKVGKLAQQDCCSFFP